MYNNSQRCRIIQKAWGEGEVLKWGFTLTFPGNQDETLNQMSGVTFARFL